MTDETTTTALLVIKPEAETEVMPLYNQAMSLLYFAEQRVIRTAEDMKPATDDLSIIRKLKKALEEKRKEYLSPLQVQVKTINDAFKFLMEPIEQADLITGGKMLAFDAEQKRIRKEQEEVNRLRMEAAQKEMELKGELTESVNLVEVSPEAPKRVFTEMGTVGQRMIRKWEVIDFQAVPDDLKVIDAGKVTKLVKAGIGTIAGIRIYEESIITVNAR